MGSEMKQSNAEIIMEAIQYLYEQEQLVTREVLADFTGLKMTIIDDRTAILVDEGLLRRVQRGVFVPAVLHPLARIIKSTVIPGITILEDIWEIEIGGEHAMTLTHIEARMLGALLAWSWLLPAFDFIDNGFTDCVGRGVFVPTQHLSARIMAKTVMSDGAMKIEVGDELVQTLSPREGRGLRALMSAGGGQFFDIGLVCRQLFLTTTANNDGVSA